MLEQDSSIAVHTSQQIVYAKIGDENAEEGEENVEVVNTRIAECRQWIAVQGHGIYHEGDESPRLLWVPLPVWTPADVSPDGTDEDAESETGDGRIKQYKGQVSHTFCFFLFPDKSPYTA